MKNTELTAHQRQRLTILVLEMRKIAAKAGSMHSWWDLIFDIESLLKGKDTILKLSPDGFISEAEQYFFDIGMHPPPNT